ncbi:MAG TPA: aldo/keto reductase [Acidobacteriaceae bacterium]|nr:aldo/keto reductase [Acidobacteriaceae bacterium]
MQKRNLGHSAVKIAPLVLGGNVFGWTADVATSFRILDAFVDRGFNCIDTADVYSRWVPGHVGGESETILGQWFQKSGKRDKVVLATKVGIDMGDGKEGLSRKNILQGVEASLQRLQTDYIDLYQSHRDDPSVPLEETLETYRLLVEQGKVRILGASNYCGARLAEALQVSRQKDLPSYETLQPDYNLHARKDYETDLAPVVAEYGLGVIPYFSLASGFLTGKYKTKQDAKGANREAMVGKYFDDRGERILKALEEVAQQTGAAQASIALAWLMARPGITAPIASATSVEQLETLCAAAELKLEGVAMEKLDRASAY